MAHNPALPRAFSRPPSVRVLRRIAAGTLLLLSLAVLACGSEDGPTDPNGSENGSITARVDGTPWRSTHSVGAMRSGQGFIGISGGAADNTVISFAVPDQGPGTYTLPHPTGINFNFNRLSDSRLWQALGMGELGAVGSGSITVTALDATRVAGTFSFILPPATSTGATGEIVVTEGSFDVRF